MSRVRCATFLAGAMFFTLVARADAASTPQQAFETFRDLCNSGQLDSEAGKAIRTGELVDEPGAGCEMPAANAYLAIDDTHAVARITTSFPDAGEVDAYVYLDGGAEGWRISAMRGFAMTGVPREALKGLTAKPTRTADEDDLMRNLTLMLSSDAQLRGWLSTNRQALDELATQATNADLARTLGVQTAYTDDSGTIFIEIGGMVDNVVGFLKPGPSGLPTITPSTYIWIEPLDGGWFLFRTT